MLDDCVHSSLMLGMFSPGLQRLSQNSLEGETARWGGIGWWDGRVDDWVGLDGGMAGRVVGGYICVC